MTIPRENLADIHRRIAAAAAQADRLPGDVQLVAVTKLVSVEKIIEAVESGQLVFGENYVQEAQGKIIQIKSHFPDRKISFHFIGRLQSNKAKKAAELFDVIETVDSLKLAKILDSHCRRLQKKLSVFVQVNIAREKRKAGIPAEDCENFLEQLGECQFLKVKGLMTMPPFSNDPEETRPFFRQLSQLAGKMIAKGLLGQHGRVELSMGMSGDFETAIAEGATMVRIGTAIFGGRNR